MKNYLIVFVMAIGLLICFQFEVSAYEFAKFETFIEQENLWNLEKTEFQKNLYFNWTSDKQDCTRWPAYSNSPGISFLGMKCYEILIIFGDEKIEKIEIYLYNRGDSGEIREPEKFDTLLNGILGTIEKWTGQEGKDTPNEKLMKEMITKGKKWVKGDIILAVANWSTTKKLKAGSSRGVEKIPFRAEFIILTLTKFDPDAKVTKKSTADNDQTNIASTKEVKKNVKKDNDGFTYIDGIPMVNQGQKGYCVVATAERIARYYGLDMTQHDFAQLASTQNGTDMEQLMDMFKKIKNKMRLEGKILCNSRRIVEDYNKYAEKQKQPPIGSGMAIKMDKDLLKKARCDMNKKGYKDFSRDIKKYVDLGVPLIWSVELGIVPEKPDLPQVAGAHARIISGYNLETNVIIYSDSWGKGHEKKIMKMDDAWMITQGLYIFESRNKNEYSAVRRNKIIS